MKTFLKLFILITITSFISCHTGKDIVFIDTFKDNRNKWNLHDDYADFSVNISKGNLNIEKLSINRINNGCLWLNKPIDNFSTSKDFSIMFPAKILNCDDVFNGIDFQWGTINIPNQKSKLYQINIGVAGNIHLDYYDNNGWSYLYRNKLTSVINFNKRTNGTWYYPVESRKYNKYEITQVGDSCFVYINNYKVYSNKIKVIEGNCIGIQQCLKSSWKIDYLVIKQKK